MSNRHKYRIGGKVYHVDKDLWLQCKENYVSDKDIQREYNRFFIAGIRGITYETAIAAALRKKIGGRI
jgi:hypothetical protein